MSPLPPLSRPADRVAVVTGANKGVGYHIAAQLVASRLFGTVILACRHEERGQRAAREVGGVYMPLTVGDAASAAELAQRIGDRYGRCDVLVNNAAIAFKAADPTPFEQQTRPTIDVNYRGTLQVTQALLPLLLAPAVDDGRIVMVASMSGRLAQLAPERQRDFSARSLTLPGCDALVAAFEADVADGSHARKGCWGRSNYGLSKLALIAASRVLARERPGLAINACCPGYCKTDMSSNRGGRPTEEGARTPVLLATMPRPPTGAFWQDERPIQW